MYHLTAGVLTSSPSRLCCFRLLISSAAQSPRPNSSQFEPPAPLRKMPAFTLYGHLASPNHDRVALTLAIAGFTDFEYVTVDLSSGEQKVEPHPFPQGAESSLLTQCSRLSI